MRSNGKDSNLALADDHSQLVTDALRKRLNMRRGAMSNLIKSYLAGFKGISTMRREFWGIQLLVLINAIAFYSMANMAAIYLNQDVGISKEQTGMFLAGFAVLIAAMSFPCGMLIDRIGFRNGMLMGATCSLLGRTGLGILPFLGGPSDIRPMLIGAIILAGVGEAFLQPIIAAGTARFSSKEMRTVAFNIQVVILQIGGVLVGLFIQATRIPDGGNSHFFFTAAALAIPTALVAYFFVKDESPATSGTEEPIRQESVQKISPWALLRQLVRERPFRMIMLLLIMLIGTRMAFSFQGVLYNPYYIAVLGKKVELGLLVLINPLVIGLGLVFLTPLFNKIKSYNRVTVGMGVIAGSVLLLATPPQLLQGYGLSVDQAYYTMAVTQIIVFAIGEMLFSPAIKQYILSVAPAEKLTTYAGVFSLSNIPGRFLPAMISGFLLARYCPDGVREKIQTGALPYGDSPEMMYVIMGAICLTGPVFLVLAKKWYKKA